jgi:hypothetical protein
MLVEQSFLTTRSSMILTLGTLIACVFVSVGAANETGVPRNEMPPEVWGSELAMTSAEARSAASLKSASTSWLMLMYGTQSQLAFTVAVHPVTPLLRGTCTCGGSWLAGWLGRSLRCFML